MRLLIDRSLMLVALAVLGPSPVLAQVSCGDTIGPGQTVVLTVDVGPCPTSVAPALMVVGPATLDLAGHQVLCDMNDPPIGIEIGGKGAKVLRGSVADCGVGLRLVGEGKHKVEDVLARDSVFEGVDVQSDKNKLKRVAAVGNGDDGFLVDEDGNKIEDAEAVGNTEDGLRIDGDKNSVKRVVAAGNGGDGVRIDGNDNKIKDCRSVTSGEDGIELNGDGNKIEKCLTSANSPMNAGLDVDGSNNQLKKNVVLGNDFGIAVFGGGGNAIKQNVALGSALVDMNDGNPDCGTNTWQKNTFGTSDADGVANAPCIE